jgi:hypothetical protein
MFPVSKARWEMHLSTWLSICIESCKLFWRECTEANHFYSFSVTLPWICCRINASTWHTYLLRFFFPVIIRTKAAPAGSSTHTTIVRITADPVYTKQYVQHWNIFPISTELIQIKFQRFKFVAGRFLYWSAQEKHDFPKSTLSISSVLSSYSVSSTVRTSATGNKRHDYILYGKNSRYENDLALWVVGEV